MRKQVTPPQPTVPECQVYRGYLIRYSPFSQTIWIEKDGFRISHAANVDDARRTIEMLTAQ